MIQALTGIMALTGDPDARRPRPATRPSTIRRESWRAVGLLAKLVEGKGGQVDVAMYDVMLSQLNYLAGAWLNAGERASRYPFRRIRTSCRRRSSRRSDGWMAVFITHDEFWRSFAEEVEHREWVTDPRFASMAARRENRSDVLAVVSEALMQDTTERWTQRLAPLGVVAAGVETMEKALASEQTRARRMVTEIPTPGGTIRGVGNPIKISGMEERFDPPPKLGEHDNLAKRQGA